MILADHGRYDEALDDLRKVESSTAFGTDGYSLAKKAIARTLEMAGRPMEALDELGPVIEAWQQFPVWTLPGMLNVYTDIASSAGVSVDARYSDVLLMWANNVGLQMSAELAVSDLRGAVMYASRELNRGNERFLALCRSIQDQPRETLEGIISEYITSEPIDHFRERARRLLDEPAG